MQLRWLSVINLRHLGKCSFHTETYLSVCVCVCVCTHIQNPVSHEETYLWSVTDPIMNTVCQTFHFHTETCTSLSVCHTHFIFIYFFTLLMFRLTFYLLLFNKCFCFLLQSSAKKNKSSLAISVSFPQWITNCLPHSNKLLDNGIISIQLVV